MISVPPDIDPEQTIVMRAHQIVTRWHQLRQSRPFEEVIQRSLDMPWDPFLTTDVKIAIRRVAEAIRDGRGHAIHNRRPLLSIARRTLVRST
jgi:hypothetical protein